MPAASILFPHLSIFSFLQLSLLIFISSQLQLGSSWAILCPVSLLALSSSIFIFFLFLFILSSLLFLSGEVVEVTVIFSAEGHSRCGTCPPYDKDKYDNEPAHMIKACLEIWSRIRWCVVVVTLGHMVTTLKWWTLILGVIPLQPGHMARVYMTTVKSDYIWSEKIWQNYTTARPYGWSRYGNTATWQYGQSR